MTYRATSERSGKPARSLLTAAALLLLPCAVATAQTVPEPAAAAAAAASAPVGGASKRVCVDVEVDGDRTLSYDCLSQQLAPPATSGAAASESAAHALANGPSNRVGTFNLSTEQNRFGSNWGKSVNPQRPAPPPAVPIGR